MVALPAPGFFVTGTPTNLEAKQALDDMVAYAKGGRRQVWIGAAAMIPYSPAPPTRAVYQQTATATDLEALEYSGTFDTYASFVLRMPKSWDLGAVAFRPRWTQTIAGTGDVVWQFYASNSHDGLGLATVGSAVTNSIDTAQGVAKDHEGPLSTPIAITSPAIGDLIQFRVGRISTHGSDTLTVIASLIGITLEYTAAAGNDE